MSKILIILMILAALQSLNLKWSDLFDFMVADKATRAVTKIDWKPISIFPEEAKRFNRPKPTDASAAKRVRL